MERHFDPAFQQAPPDTLFLPVLVPEHNLDTRFRLSRYTRTL